MTKRKKRKTQKEYTKNKPKMHNVIILIIRLKNYIKNYLKTNRKFVIMLGILFVIAFIPHLIFTLNNNLGMTWWGGGADCAFYSSAGLACKKVLQNPVKFWFNVLFDNYSASDYVNMGFIHENDIQTIFRAPSYSFYLGFLFLFFKPGLMLVFITNSILWALTSVLIFLIAKNIFKKKSIGFILFIISLIYLPFYFDSYIPNTENFVLTVLALLFYFTVKAIITKRKLFIFLTGVMIPILTLARTSFMYIIYPYFSVFLFLLYRETTRENFRKQVIIFLLGFFLIFLPWKILCYRVSGKFSFFSPTVKKISDVNAGRTMIQELNPQYDGWSTGRIFDNYYRSSIEEVPKNRNLWYRMCYIGGKAASKNIRDNFGGVIILIIKKAFRLIFYPRFLIQKIGEFFMSSGLPLIVFHMIIVIIGILGAAFCLKDFRFTFFLIIIPLYLSLIHGISHFESRYNLPGMLSFIILCGFFINYINEYWIKEKKYKFTKYFFISCAMVAFFGLINLFFPLSNITKIINNPVSAYSFKIILMNLLILSFAIALFIINVSIIGKWYSLAGSGIICFILLLSYNTFSITSKNWHEWSIDLDSNNEKIVQTIHLPDHFDISKYDGASIEIDIRNLKGNNSIVRFELDREEIAIFSNKLPAHKSSLYIPKKLERSCDERKWLSLPISIEKLKARKKIDISVTMTNVKKGGIRLYGDYIYDKNNIENPSFYRNCRYHKSSVYSEKILNFDDRVTEKYNLQSKSRNSYHYKNLIVSSNDLSDKKGLQTGEYRIRLLLKNKGGYYYQERYSQIAEYRPWILSLINPLDNGIIVWLKDMKKGYLPVTENMHSYLVQEVDRYYSGYDIY